MKHFKISVYFAYLAPSLALAQPVITAQPTNQFLASGTTASFSVSATGTAPLAYQWLLEGTALAGDTHGVLSLANPQPSQWGYYSVIVSNSTGSVTSQVAELKVFVAAPHSLTGIQVTNGSANLGFAGETTVPFAPYYDLYPLEVSSDLVTWVPLATVQRTNTALNTLNFADTNAAMFSQRFYRTPSNGLVTPDPEPTGPYPVGTFSMLLTNPNRGNAQFMVTFWYPAVAQAGVLPAKYVDPQVAAPTGVEEYAYYDWANIGGGNWDSQAAAFRSHSLSNTPLATDVTSFPVVLYDPGEEGHRRENTDKVEDLASWGYVVVGLDTSDTSVSVFPNGTVVDGQTVAWTISAQDADIEGRLLDMQYVLDELENLNVGGPPLGGRLNLEEIGAFGWSVGGATAAQLCLRDPRCKAGAAMDGFYFETNLLTQPLSVPWLYFAQDEPYPYPGVLLPDGRLEDRLQIYNEQVSNAYWVQLVSTVHGNFSDYGLIDPTELVSWGTPMSGQYLPGARVTQIVRAYLLSFFNKFLQGENDHLLDGPSPAYPEVEQFLSASNVSATPEYPVAALVQGTNGNFYGTTEYGGANGIGTVFQVTTNGMLTTLVSFNRSNGSHPVAALTAGSDGNFYGTTEYGGTNGNNGTVFKMTAAGMLTTLVSFNGTNGSYPVAGLVQGTNGNYYGTTMVGGANYCGTVFEMSSTGVLTTLVSFNYTDGALPLAGLLQSTNGDFYGTTSVGGDLGLNSGYGEGTVFSMTSVGALTTLVEFSGNNGENPAAGLVQGTNGNFYGTTALGGNLNLNAGSGLGTVFKITPAGVLTTLLEFNATNGSFCLSGLVQGSDGNFYGTAEGSGGSAFKMTVAGSLTTLVTFNGTDGSAPAAGLLQGSDGNFYGTTEYGGAGVFGTVFQMTSAGALTTLASFGSTNAP